MKHVYRLTALVLAVLLLTLCASAEAVDFGALAAKGKEDAHVGVTVTCPPRFGVMYSCSGTEEYAVFMDSDHRFYISDYSGNIVFSADPDVLSLELTEGDFITAYFQNGDFRVYDITGKQLSVERYALQNDCRAEATGVGDEYALILNNATDRATGQQCCLLLDPSGRYLAADRFGSFYQGVVICCRDGKWGAQEPFGKTVLPYAYDYLEFANDGVLACRKNGSFGLIDLEGNTLVPFEYDEMEVLSNDGCRRVAVRQGNIWGVIDLTGRVRVPLEYALVSSGGLAQIGDQTVQRYAVKKAGETIWYSCFEDGAVQFLGSPAIPSDVRILSGDRFVRKTPGETTYELVDAQGRCLIEEKMLSFEAFDGGFYCTSKDRTGEVTGRIYSEDLELRRQITSVAAGSSAQFKGFAYTDSALLVQCFTQDRVEIYDYDGTLIDVVKNAYLWAVYNHKTIVLRRGDLYAVGTSDGKHLTPFQYSDTGSIRMADGEDELVNVTQGEAHYLMHNSGTVMLKDISRGVRLLDGVDSGHALFRVGDQSGFLYIAPPELCFADANDADWFAKSVAFCVNAGLMRGVGNARFAPQTAMTRAMLVQVLYNLSGEPAGPCGFEDVADTAWYAGAVNWAAANEIVNGVSADRFAPDAPVTREQMVTILRRYALRFGAAEGEPDALAGFSDRDRVSAYAEDALCWAVTAGLINGRTPTTMEPQGQAKRAEIATVLMRFVNLMAAGNE